MVSCIAANQRTNDRRVGKLDQRRFED
jgi:hypothetical protein